MSGISSSSSHSGNSGSGKTSVIQRYTANQHTPVGDAHTGTEPQLPRLTTISLRVPGSAGMISVTFWDVPANVEDFMRAEIYSDTDAIISEALFNIHKQPCCFFFFLQCSNKKKSW